MTILLTESYIHYDLITFICQKLTNIFISPVVRSVIPDVFQCLVYIAHNQDRLAQKARSSHTNCNHLCELL